MKDIRGNVISPSSIDRGLVTSTIAGAIGMVFFVSSGGAFLTGFARQLGASQFEIGVMNAFVPMAAIAQLLSSYTIERKGWRRKPILCISLSVMRLLWLPILMLPFWFGYTQNGPPSAHTASIAVGLALGLMAISQLLSGFGSLAWQAWMGDLVPAERRGRFFGIRTTIVNAVNVVVGLAIGWYLDIDNSFQAFGIVFGVGVFFGVLDLVIHAFVPEPAPQRAPQTQPFMRMCTNPFTDVNYKGFIWFNLAWNFAVWIMLPFLPMYQLETLDMSYYWISWAGNAFMIAMMAASPLAGRLVDRVGGRKVFVTSFALLTSMPIFWLVMNKSNAIPLNLLLNVFAGVLNAGAMVSMSQLMLANSPINERSIYIAVYSAIGGITGTIGPLIGGWIGDTLSGRILSIGPFMLPGLKVVFVTSLVLRLLTLPLLATVKEGRPESMT